MCTPAHKDTGDNSGIRISMCTDLLMCLLSLCTCEFLMSLLTQGVLTRWNSAKLKSRPVTQGELKRQVRSFCLLDESCMHVGKVHRYAKRACKVEGQCACACACVFAGGERGGTDSHKSAQTVRVDGILRKGAYVNEGKGLKFVYVTTLLSLLGSLRQNMQTDLVVVRGALQLKTEKDLDELLGLIGAVQDEDLKKLTVAAFAASAVIGVGGSIIGGETGGAVYWVTYLGAGIPLALIGIGSVAPGIIGNAVETIKWKLDPTNNKERRVRHEAAHMICGYMCGLPIAGYGTDPTPECVFFDRQDGNYDEGKVYEKKRAFTNEEVERIAVTALSGLMGELQFYDKADGGTGDLEALQDVFFRSDAEKLRKPQAREEMTRWGAYTSKNMIDDYKKVYDKLIEAMDRGASVEECIATIESV
jgi:hypothetical protein